jgi:hypothetical protein
MSFSYITFWEERLKTIPFSFPMSLTRQSLVQKAMVALVCEALKRKGAG